MNTLENRNKDGVELPAPLLEHDVVERIEHYLNNGDDDKAVDILISGLLLEHDVVERIEHYLNNGDDDKAVDILIGGLKDSVSLFVDSDFRDRLAVSIAIVLNKCFEYDKFSEFCKELPSKFKSSLIIGEGEAVYSQPMVELLEIFNGAIESAVYRLEIKLLLEVVHKDIVRSMLEEDIRVYSGDGGSDGRQILRFGLHSPEDGLANEGFGPGRAAAVLPLVEFLEDDDSYADDDSGGADIVDDLKSSGIFYRMMEAIRNISTSLTDKNDLSGLRKVVYLIVPITSIEDVQNGTFNVESLGDELYTLEINASEDGGVVYRHISVDRGIIDYRPSDGGGVADLELFMGVGSCAEHEGMFREQSREYSPQDIRDLAELLGNLVPIGYKDPSIYPSAIQVTEEYRQSELSEE